MKVVLIIAGCFALVWLVPVYLSFYSPSLKRLRAPAYLAYILLIGGMLNFASFSIISLFIGGDAVGNPPVDGKYYVSEHGRRTEVSRQVYEYSLLHSHSVWITFPLMFVGVLILHSEHDKRKPRPTDHRLT